jgi:hypothetical protein
MKDEVKVELVDGSYRKGTLLDVQASIGGKTQAIKIQDTKENIHIINMDNVLELVYYKDVIKDIK